MIRNLKVGVLAATLPLTALGALAPSAHAADEFHCSVTPCRLKLSADGSGATAHHFFVIESKSKFETLALTCASLRGTAELTNANDITLGWVKGTTDREAYDSCNFLGVPIAFHMNSCKYTFTSDARNAKLETVPAAGRAGEAEVHIICDVADVIEFTVGNCVLRIPPQTLGGGGTKGGIGYHTIGESPNREITLTINLSGIVVTTSGKCEGLFKQGEELEGTYRTGNTLLTAETAAGVMAEAWFE